MPTYIGENKIVDRYLGDRFLEAAYIGDTKVYDPYTEITGTLPLIFHSRVAVALKNYRIYGTAGGTGVQTENLFDPATINFNHRVDGSGNIIYDSRNDCSDYIEVESATDYNQNDDNQYISEYDANKGFVKRTATQAGRFNTSNTTKYIIVSFGKNVYTNYMIVKGQSSPPQYIPHGYKIPILNTSGITENLFDYQTMAYGVSDRYLTASGYKAASQYWVITDYIPCNDAVFVLSRVGGNLPSICGYDGQKNFVSGKAYNTGGTATKENIIVDFGTTVKYVRFSWYENGITFDNISEIMLVKGSTPPDHYIPHRYETDYNLYIGDSKLGEEEYLEYRSKRADKLIYDRTSIDDASLRRVRMIIDAGNSTVLPAGITYATTGLIAYRGTECPKLTRESAAAHDDIYDYNLPAAQFQTTAKDTKGGIFYRGYAILSDGTLIYGDTVGVTLNEQATEIIETLRIVSTDIPLYPTIWKRTENLCPSFTYQGVIQAVDGEYVFSTGYVSTEKFEINSAKLEFVAGMVGKTFRLWGVAFYNENNEYISMAQAQNASSLYAQIPANAKYAACTCSVNPLGQHTYPLDIVNPYLIYSSTAPDHYIPYGVEPTDPPAPLPAINTYKGENTLSSSETVGSVTVKGRISIRNLVESIIPDANIYPNGQIMNPPDTDQYELVVAPVQSGKTYTLYVSTDESAVVFAFYATYPTVGSTAYDNQRQVISGVHKYTFTSPIDGYIAFRDKTATAVELIVEGEIKR